MKAAGGLDSNLVGSHGDLVAGGALAGDRTVAGTVEDHTKLARLRPSPMPGFGSAQKVES